MTAPGTERPTESGGGDADLRDQSDTCEECGRLHTDHTLWEFYARVMPVLLVFVLVAWIARLLPL